MRCVLLQPGVAELVLGTCPSGDDGGQQRDEWDTAAGQAIAMASGAQVRGLLEDATEGVDMSQTLRCLSVARQMPTLRTEWVFFR